MHGEQDDLVVNTPAYGSEGPRFDPRQHPFVQLSLRWLLTITYKLLEFDFSVYHPVFQMRRKTEAPSQSPSWCPLVKLNTFLSLCNLTRAANTTQKAERKLSYLLLRK